MNHGEQGVYHKKEDIYPRQSQIRIMTGQIFGCYGADSEETARDMGRFYPKNPTCHSIGRLTVGYGTFDEENVSPDDRFFENDHVLVAFCGEIFDLPPGSSLDGQGYAGILATAYNKYGADCIAGIEGFFSLLVYDKREKKALFACDRTGGIRTGYYSILPDCFCFASGIKPLLTVRPPEINTTALYSYLRMGFAVPPHTFFKGIFQVIPGECMVVTDQGHTSVCLQPHIPCEDHSAGTLAARYMDTIRAAVRDRALLSPNKKTIVMLSGGVDSACIAALARECIPDLEAVTLDIGNERNKDAYYASRVAGFLGIKNHRHTVNAECLMELPRIVWHAESPVTSLLYYHIATHAKKHGDVVLGGSGNDGIYGTFSFHLDDVHRSRSPVLRLMKPFLTRIPGKKLPGWCLDLYRIYKPPGSIQDSVPGTELPGMYMDLYTRWNHEEISGATRMDPDTLRAKTLADIRDLLPPTGNVFERFRILDDRIFSYHYRTILGKNFPDACCLDLREPFMDRAVESIVMGLPEDMKNRTVGGKQVRKYFFKKYIAKELLPEDVVYRNKDVQGMPVTAWLNDIPGIKEAVIKKLRKDDAVFNSGKITHLLTSGSDLHTLRILCPLINYCIWKEMFITAGALNDSPRDLFYYLD
jgi:asparagine synthetase B (glutamine-hydrolysing)